MYTANNQVIIEDLYDDNTQPPDEDIIEYAEYIGINSKDVNFINFKLYKSKRFLNSDIWIK